jgi:thiol-disulfide isomerase/thioredoxin
MIMLIHLVFCYTVVGQTSSPASAHDTIAYKISIAIKPSTHNKLFLESYFGNALLLIDTSTVNSVTNEVVFTGTKKLQQGVYVVSNEQGRRIFDFFVDDNPFFSVSLDFSNQQNPQINYVGSNINTEWFEFGKYISVTLAEKQKLTQQLDYTTDPVEEIKCQLLLDKIQTAYIKHRQDLIDKDPASLLSVIMPAIFEPILPDSMLVQNNFDDSMAAKQFISDQYWNGIKFWDSRLAHTPFFLPKLKKYYKDVVSYKTDTIIKKMDWMLSYAAASDEMTRLMMEDFIEASTNHTYHWNDSVFIHLFEKHIAPKKYSWLSESQRQMISEKAYYLMGKMIGSPAEDIQLPNLQGQATSLYNIKSNYTILAFWDPTCSHCRETLPKLDSMYRTQWKRKGISIFAFGSESDGNIGDWTNYIAQHQLQDWTNVYNTQEENRNRIKAGKKGYPEIYDVWYYPSFFVLDKNKRFMAKKFTYEQMVDFLKLNVK